MFSKEELNNLLIFLSRVEVKGEEAYVWVGLNEKAKYNLNQLLSQPNQIAQTSEKEEVKEQKKDIR